MVSKHTSTAEYLEGLRAFVQGADENCPYTDKRRRDRWNFGWLNASESPVSVEVRETNRAAR